MQAGPMLPQGVLRPAQLCSAWASFKGHGQGEPRGETAAQARSAACSSACEWSKFSFEGRAEWGPRVSPVSPEIRVWREMWAPREQSWMMLTVGNTSLERQLS